MMMATGLFPLGHIVITQGIKALIDDQQSAVNNNDLLALLHRHQSGDDGDVCEQDRQSNQDALKHQLRIFSVYQQTNTLWIITEADRSSTTILLPEEY